MGPYFSRLNAIQSNLDVHNLHPIQSINTYYEVELANYVPVIILIMTFNLDKTAIVIRS